MNYWFTTGDPIKRIAQLSDELLTQADIRNKIDGMITFLNESSQIGFAEGSDGKEYFFKKAFIIAADRKQPIHIGTKLRFIPANLDEDSLMATNIEIL